MLYITKAHSVVTSIILIWLGTEWKEINSKGEGAEKGRSRCPRGGWLGCKTGSEIFANEKNDEILPI